MIKPIKNKSLFADFIHENNNIYISFEMKMKKILKREEFL